MMPRFGLFTLNSRRVKPADLFTGKNNMRNLNRIVWLVAALLLSLTSYAGDIEVKGAWTRATAPGQVQASVDLSITSKQSATLVGVSSPACKVGELHSMTTDQDGMMRMRQVKAIELPAGKTVNLGESGYHLMLNELKTPLREGDSVPLTLTIKVGKQGEVKIETKAEVKSLTATKAELQEEEHQHMHMQMR
jgi:copper(I)-binding protein